MRYDFFKDFSCRRPKVKFWNLISASHSLFVNANESKAILQSITTTSKVFPTGKSFVPLCIIVDDDCVKDVFPLTGWKAKDEVFVMWNYFCKCKQSYDDESLRSCETQENIDNVSINIQEEIFAHKNSRKPGKKQAIKDNISSLSELQSVSADALVKLHICMI